VGSLHRLRDAVERGWPNPLELEEHSHAGLSARYVAGASGLPFGVLRAYQGTGLEGRSDSMASVRCPFTGEDVAAVAALNPDVAVIHAQQSDREGNVQLWGLTGVQKEAVLAARASIVTVEELVEELVQQPGGVVLPHWVVGAVVHVPGGSHPSYAAGFSERDNDFYLQWDRVSRDRSTFTSWMKTHVLDVPSPIRPST
jgi:glutaconate CoA-transferase subunit A